jgi:predicted alpha/beta hydrolase
MELKLLEGRGSCAVPLGVYRREGARSAVLILPALGTRAKYYERFAAELHAQGRTAAIMELRGHGHSELRASRREDWGFRELIEQDIPTAIAYLQGVAPDAAVYLCGHSLGGHLAVALAALSPGSFRGLALVACGTPWHALFRGRDRVRLRVLLRLMPLLQALWGYFPGDRVGFGGREARTLMRDWSELATANRYAVTGIERDIEAGIAAYTGPVLALRMAEDRLGPAAAVAAVTDRFGCARLSEQVLEGAEQGVRADHYGWCREPRAAAGRVGAWIDADLGPAGAA